MKRIRDEQGAALMVAIIILFIVLGMGTALVATATGQKHTASNQQNSESAYSLAEAALNAQIYALSVMWPTNKDYQATASGNGALNNYGYPPYCNASSATNTYCPTAKDLSSYPSNSTSCPAGTPGDAWNTSRSTPYRSEWTTYVRDGGAQTSSQQEVFTSAEETQPYYNASYNPINATNYLWVRSVATVNCKTVTLVDQVAMQTNSLSFPDYVVTANAITAGNSGNKIILNLQDATTGATVDVSLRCQGGSLGGTGTPPNGNCDNLSSSQVAPSTMSSSYFAGAASSTTLTASQLSEVETMAQQDGGYYAPGSACPTESQLTNKVVYIDGNSSYPVSCTYNGSSTINSAAVPGLLVVPYGTLSFTGGDIFYGLIYAANQQSSSGAVVSLSGNSTVFGGIDIDGNGAVGLGDSGNGTNCTDADQANNKCGDLEYDAAAFNSLLGFGGADATPNSFRQLPAGQ